MMINQSKWLKTPVSQTGEVYVRVYLIMDNRFSGTGHINFIEEEIP
jgi:hypothetical protein